MNRVVDADGHVFEDATITDYIEEPYRSRSNFKGGLARLWPTLDGHHYGHGLRSPGAFGGAKAVGPDEWVNFQDEAEIEYRVCIQRLGWVWG